ncbi:protein of unknown function [Caballeronia sp. S22]
MSRASRTACRRRATRPTRSTRRSSSRSCVRSSDAISRCLRPSSCCRRRRMREFRCADSAIVRIFYGSKRFTFVGTAHHIHFSVANPKLSKKYAANLNNRSAGPILVRIDARRSSIRAARAQ